MSLTKVCRYVIATTLVIVAVIHLLPLIGVLGSERLSSLYGIPIDDPNLEILMRHRAVLFGILGTFILIAAFQAQLQLLALLAGFVSVNSFLWLVQSTGDFNEQLAGVFFADLIALVCLIVGAIAWYVQRRALNQS